MKLLAIIYICLLFFQTGHSEEGADPSLDKPSTDQDVEKASLPYVIKSEELLTLGNDIKADKSDIYKLIMRKRTTKEKEKLDLMMHSLVDAHEALNKKIKKYLKLKEEVRYRYPGKKIIRKRDYLPLRIQSIEEIEDEVGLDGQLTKLKKKVDKKYLPFLNKKELEKAKIVREEREEKVRKLNKNKRIEFSQ